MSVDFVRDQIMNHNHILVSRAFYR